MDMERGLLMLMLTTVVDSSVKPVAIMEAMVDLPTPSESALLMPKPTMAVMAMAVMEAMAATDTARGPLMPMPTMAVMAMADMEAMAATDTARGPLTPMLAMAVMEAMEAMEAMVVTDTARGLLMPMPTMAVMAMAVMEAMVAMDTARGPPMLTTVDTDTAVDTAAMAVMAMASKCNKSLI